MIRKTLAVGIIFLFIVTSIGSVGLELKDVDIPHVESVEGPMDSAWPMFCHDVRHTGRSPYSTINNNGVEKWQFRTDGWADGSPVIDNNGVIYIGSKNFYAIYPNGTLKWVYDSPHHISHAPAIDDNGVIYFGTVEAMPDYLYALYPNGTMKWKYRTDDDIYSSPSIGNGGTIYFGDSSGYINALHQNGTLRWRYETNDAVLSSPAIGDDGIIYCGSHDNNLYALYTNNGTVKWSFTTGHWIRTSPCIADDGTIYCVSLDDYLYAICQNGTMKWKTNVGGGTSPTIAQDGTIYAGYNNLYAIYPTNGSIKWTFAPGSNRKIRGGTPCNSIEGTIYFGTNIGETDGGELIAVNPDGTEKWREQIANLWVESAPAIAEDGTVYIGSSWQPTKGYLHAFGEGEENNPPNKPTIIGETNGKYGESYDYTFTAVDPESDDIWYYVDWGDDSSSGWLGPYSSGEAITLSHIWVEQDTYTLRCRAKDTLGGVSEWGTLEVTMPVNQQYQYPLLELFRQRFPLLYQLFIRVLAELNI